MLRLIAMSRKNRFWIEPIVLIATNKYGIQTTQLYFNTDLIGEI